MIFVGKGSKAPYIEVLHQGMGCYMINMYDSFGYLVWSADDQSKEFADTMVENFIETNGYQIIGPQESVVIRDGKVYAK